MSGSNNFAGEMATAAWRTLPPAGITAGVLSGGIDPQWVIAIPTAIFVILQSAYLLWKWQRERKAKRRGHVD